MQPAGLQAMQRGVAAAGAHQVVVGAVLDDAAALDGDDAVAVRTVESRCAITITVRPRAIWRMFCCTMRSLS